MKEPMTALAYLEKLRGATVAAPVSRLEKAIQELDRPARARGPTAVFVRTLALNVNGAQMLAPNFARRSFMIMPIGTSVTIAPHAIGYTLQPGQGWAVPTANGPFLMREEEFGSFMWNQWDYLTTAFGTSVIVFEEVYLS